MDIKAEQIRLMKHAIGFDIKKIKRGKYVAWRNYFCSYSKSEDWEKLVNAELASKEEREKAVYYFVEDKGFRKLEEIFEIKIVEAK